MSFFKNIVLLTTCCVFSSFGFGQFLNSGSSTYSTAEFICKDNTTHTYIVGNYVCNLALDTLTVGPDSCTNNVATPSNIYLAKLNEDGQALWLKSSVLTDENSTYTIWGAFSDANNNLWIGGSYSDSMCFENQRIKSNSLYDVFVARFLPNGNLDTLMGGFAKNTSTFISLCGFQKGFNNTALLYGSFNGEMKSSIDTVNHINSQLFLTEIDENFHSRFLYTKLDTPIVVSDSSAILALGINNSKIKVAISVDRAREFRIDTVYQADTINRIDTNLVTIPENTFIGEFDLSSNFTYQLRTNYSHLTHLHLKNDNTYYLLENSLLSDIRNVKIDSYTSSNILNWSFETENTDSRITLIGNNLSADNTGNVYWGGYFKSSWNGRSFIIGGNTISANKDKTGLFVKLDNSGGVNWAQTLGSTTTQSDYYNHNDALNDVLVLAESNILGGGYFGNELSISGLQISNENGANNLFVGHLDPYPNFVVEISPSESTDICQNDSVLLSVTENSSYTYQWIKDDNIIADATSNQIYAKDSGSYWVVVSNSSISYTKTSAKTLVNVNKLPIAEAQTLNDTIFCQGETALLEAPSYIDHSYQWYHNSQVISGAQLNSFTAYKTGSYFVRITSPENCFQNSNAITLEVTEPSAEIITTGSLSICDGDSVKLEALHNNEMKYQWFFDEEPLPNDTLNYFYAKISGAYQIETTVLDNCSAISESSDVSVIPSPPAIIQFSGDSVLCSGESTTLVANSGFGLTYLWMLGNDTLPDQSSSILNTDRAGIYRAIVGFEGSCSRWSDTKEIIVNPLPEVTMQIDGETEICKGQQTLLSTTNNSSYSYKWFRNNIEIENELTSNIHANETGTYFSEVSNQFECSQKTPYASIFVKSSPDAAIFIDGDTTFCEQTHVDLFVYEQPYLSYQWFKNDVPLSNQTSYLLNITESGNYYAEITNVENLCQGISRSVETQRIPAPNETISLSGSLPICDGDSITLSVSDNTNWNYQWYFNGYEIYQDTLSSFVAHEAGSYSTRIENSFGCSNTTNTVSVSLLDNPIPPITINGLFLSTTENSTLIWNYNGEPIDGAVNHLFLVENSGNYSVTAYYPNGCNATSEVVSICNPAPEISINESYLTANVGIGYQWYFEDEKIEGAILQTHKAQVSGFYSVAVTCDGGYTSVSDAVQVCIPVPEIKQTSINVLEASQGNSYQWYKNDEILDGEDARVLVVKSAGNYKVWVEDFEGCSSFSKPFYVNYTGVDESKNETIQLYPNPFSDMLFISCNSSIKMEAKVEVFDIYGQSVFLKSTKLNANINLSGLKAGVYFILVETPTQIYKQKIIRK